MVRAERPNKGGGLGIMRGCMRTGKEIDGVECWSMAVCTLFIDTMYKVKEII